MRWPDGGPGEPDLWDEVDVAIDRIQEPLDEWMLTVRRVDPDALIVSVQGGGWGAESFGVTFDQAVTLAEMLLKEVGTYRAVPLLLNAGADDD